MENDVGHFLTAQGLGRLLAEHPADGVENVAFARAIGADDRGDSVVKFQNCFVTEGFESLHLQPL